MRIVSPIAGFALATAASVAPAAPATSPQAAQQVVRAYYAALNARNYARAYALWDQNGAASGKSLAQFRQGFAQTASTRVVTQAPVNPDAGMSQRWITVPVDVYAVLRNGKRQHFRGAYTLHRVVAGVGAPASQESWHISSAGLAPVR